MESLLLSMCKYHHTLEMVSVGQKRRRRASYVQFSLGRKGGKGGEEEESHRLFCNTASPGLQAEPEGASGFGRVGQTEE